MAAIWLQINVLVYAAKLVLNDFVILKKLIIKIV
jgi:hypothetical protein